MWALLLRLAEGEGGMVWREVKGVGLCGLAQRMCGFGLALANVIVACDNDRARPSPMGGRQATNAYVEKGLAVFFQ